VIADFGPQICSALAVAESREWLCTNGIGGFASGTVAGLLTRRYHGLLVAALAPPLGRTLLVAKLDERIEYDGLSRSLSTNRWADGTIDPAGHHHLDPALHRQAPSLLRRSVEPSPAARVSQGA